MAVAMPGGPWFLCTRCKDLFRPPLLTRLFGRKVRCPKCDSGEVVRPHFGQV